MYPPQPMVSQIRAVLKAYVRNGRRLLWWGGVVDRFLEEGKSVFAYANNHYQNHSPSTVERFLELRRGDR